LTLLIIVVIACIIIGGVSSLNAKANNAQHRASTRSSYEVENEEWNKWERIIFNDYKAIMGFDGELPLPGDLILSNGAKINRTNYFRNKKYVNPLNHIDWSNNDAINTLIQKYNLPTNDELNAITQYIVINSKPIDRNNYTDLAAVMYYCVKRAVNERGYAYGVNYFDDRKIILEQQEIIYKKHPWLSNDPTKK
jgi:hypothetical protein